MKSKKIRPIRRELTDASQILCDALGVYDFEDAKTALKKLRRRLNLPRRKFIRSWICEGRDRWVLCLNLHGNLRQILRDAGFNPPLGITDRKILKAVHKLMARRKRGKKE